MSNAIHELWGRGEDYDTLHNDVRARTASLWPQHLSSTFRFELDPFHGSRPTNERRQIYESFSYMGFKGSIVMSQPDLQFTVFEDYVLDGRVPLQVFLGRHVADSGRKALNKYDLKKRNYIATTSMDAELSLVTANMAMAAPGKLVYDPFVGTGSFPLACAHFGAVVYGSDLDGRMLRGKQGKNVKTNFEQYNTSSQYLAGFVADLTNSPLRRGRLLDAIVCDPPYGVREGLKVLGSTRVALQEVVLLNDGTPAHLQSGYVPPKKPYSFFRMLDDILEFSAEMLIDGGRLCMWMPVAGAVDEAAVGNVDTDTEVREREYDIPTHPALEMVSCCTQRFNKWSRRLLTYKRLNDSRINEADLLAYKTERLLIVDGTHPSLKSTANELNAFRKMYFQGFKERSPFSGV